MIELHTTQKTVTPPFQQVLEPVQRKATYALTHAIIRTTTAFEGNDMLLVLTELVSLTERKTMIQVTSLHNLINRLDSFVAVANFKLMTPQSHI